MLKYLIRMFGLKGSWWWACRHMQRGMVVYRLRDSGIVYFTYDKGKRKINAIIWWETSTEGKEWGVSMNDVYASDFMLQHERTDYRELHRQSQLKCDDKPLTNGQLRSHLKQGTTKRDIKNLAAEKGPAPKPIKPARTGE